jgi:GT2 family glycosyltransferase/4-amino-4-deoxy-L-arabinose transferase-like glycosyltransferase
MKYLLSIIYVYYNTPIEIKQSIKSLESAMGKINHEVIIVDNLSSISIPKEISKLPNVKIIKNNKNYGYGNGLNIGVSHSKGKYLLLTNTDTIFLKNSIMNLLSKIEKDPKIGIIGPQLINSEGKTAQSISGMPYLLQSIFAFSLLGKIWPGNYIRKSYHNLNLDRNKEHNVDVVSGACMMIKKSIFDSVNGFDKNFFMYFEEADFCFRVKKNGYKILYYPQAKVVHLIGKSNQDKKWIEEKFEQSRFIFLKKYHGLVPALLGESILRFLKPVNVAMFSILTLFVFLNIYKLAEGMSFIGDQGWFYLSARDMVINGRIPLVGIASSHPWLHQGPLWTYMLASFFWIFGFNPLNGAYLSICLGTISVILMYFVGSEMFSKRIGLISALLYATSPLVITFSRTPYHTDPIPLFTLLYIYSLCKWIKGNSTYFPLSIFLLAVLYNLELATSVLLFVLLAVFFFGLWKKKDWIKIIFNKKIIIYSLLAFLIPMFPVLIYDFNHNFPQTVGFIAWIGYRILRLFGFPSVHGDDQSTQSNSMVSFAFYYYQYLIFAANWLITLVIFIFSFVMLGINIIEIARKKSHNVGQILFVVWLLISLIGYFVNQTSSEAYIPIFFPAMIFLVATLFDRIMKIHFFIIPIAILIIFIAFMNSYYIYLLESSTYKSGLLNRLSIAREIISSSHGNKYNLFGIGPGSKFESFTMNYEYLTWWLGHSPSKSPQKLKFIIEENSKGIDLINNE